MRIRTMKIYVVVFLLTFQTAPAYFDLAGILDVQIRSDRVVTVWLAPLGQRMVSVTGPAWSPRPTSRA